jgi:subtilisin family serine protease
MKKYLSLILILLFLIDTGKGQEFANIHSRDPLNPEFVPGEIIIKFKDGVQTKPDLKGNIVKTGITSIDEVFLKYGVNEIGKLFPHTSEKSPVNRMPAIINPDQNAPRLHNIYRLYLDKHADIKSLAEDLQNDPSVDFAEPNYLIYTMLTEPNDALYQSGNQWYLEEIQANYAWDSVTGDTSQIIGIIDTGIDWDHPDLDGNIWRNWNEVPGNGFDDDYNGYIDDVRGWDFYNHDNNPNDDNGHGTHVAGVAGAETDNYTGIAGVAWHAQLMPLKVLSGTGSGNMADLATAINYAASNGATVINMSLGSYGESQAVKAALLNAYNTLCPVGAAGNDSYKVDNVSPPSNTYAPMYPGCYSFVIGVEASLPDGSIATFSNLDPSGFRYVWNDDGYNYEVMAPGVNIMSTYLNGGYKSLNGTSMATPIVSGAIALLKNYKPGISNEEIFARIVQFSQNGILKIPNLLTAVLQPDLLYSGMTLLDTMGSADHDGMADAGEYIDIYFTIKNAGGFADSSWAKLTLNYPGDTACIEIIDSLSYIGNLDTASYGGEVPAYTTMTGERDPFRIYIKPDVINEKEIMINYEIGAKQAFSKTGTIELLMINANELCGVLDSTFTIGPGKLWVVNRSFKITLGGVLNILPGTHLKMIKGFPVKGYVNAIGTKDSVITIEGPGGISGHGGIGSGNFSYTNFENTINLFGSINLTLDHCNFRFFYGNIFLHSGFTISDCTFSDGDNVASWGGGIINRCIFDNLLGYFGRGGYSLKLNNFSGSQNTFVDPGNAYGSNNFSAGINARIYRTLAPEYDTSFRHQYWGTTDSIEIEHYIIDFWDDPNLAQVLFYPVLEKPTADAHGCLWKVQLNGQNPRDGALEPIGCGTVKFDVYFNKPMDIAYQPFLSFGVRYPYTQHIIENNSSWNADSTIWTAYFEVGLETGDGINSIRVSDAYDTEGFRIATEKNERFQFVIQAASSLATEFSAIPGIGKIYLEWPFEDLNDLMGFNMYRFMRITDSTTTDTLKINTELITDSTYIDFQVDPGSLYGYCYKIVGTDHKESDYSEVALAIPLLTANGDANGDLQVNVLDVTAMIAYILEQNPKPFLFEASDLNFDGDIDIRDIVMLLGIIQEVNYKSAPYAITDLTPAYLDMDQGSLNLSSSGNLAAIQFSIEGTSLDKLDLTLCLQGYEYVYSCRSSRIIGLIFSFNNRIIEPGDMKLFSFTPGEGSIENISATGSGPKGEYIPVMMCYPGDLPENEFSVRLIPNPASRGTAVKVSTREEGEVTIRIMDVEGRTIFTSEKLPVVAGSLDYYWNGTDPASGHAKPGIYLCQVSLHSKVKGGFVVNKKLVLLDF